jgi:hypothetical protein
MTPQEARALWIERLESGTIQQGFGQLAAGQRRCCLGVLCDIAVEKGVIDSYQHDWGGLDIYKDVMEMVGIQSEGGDYLIDDGTKRSLIQDNDSCRLSFPEIAKIIRSEPEGLFV